MFFLKYSLLVCFHLGNRKPWDSCLIVLKAKIAVFATLIVLNYAVFAILYHFLIMSPCYMFLDPIALTIKTHISI